MNAFWLALLVQAIKAIAGAVVWEHALAAVTALLDVDLPKDEKRRRVRAELDRMFEQVPGRLLNLAIEIAVLKAAPR
jgi:hypothetical protein